MILVPTYMEAENICFLVEALARYLPDSTVLIIDDQSSDGTAGAVRDKYHDVATVEVVTRTGPRGYGLAMRDGMLRFLASGAKQLITIDADFSHDPAISVRMLEGLSPGAVVIGSRYVERVRKGDWTVRRMIGSILGNYYVRLVTGLPVADCTSGFRCYSRAALERLDLIQIRSTGYAFLVETLYWLWRAGCPLVEIPIVYRERLHGASKLSARIMVESLALPLRLVLQPEEPGVLERTPHA